MRFPYSFRRFGVVGARLRVEGSVKGSIRGRGVVEGSGVKIEAV